MSAILAAVYSPSAAAPTRPRPDPAHEEEKQLREGAQAKQLRPSQQAIVEACIATLRIQRNILREVEGIRIAQPNGIKTADIYLGCAIAELRSTFFEYTEEKKS